MEYSFVKTYKLEQQTPLIHFQPEQEGATLRATEVKPKLDRFITECYKRKNKGKDIPKEWRVGDTSALNYRMSIFVPTGTKPEISETINRLYFGNISNNDANSKKMTVMYRGRESNIQIEISCLICELLEAIDGNIEAFFALHNFGTRQTKGFGGFRLVKKDNVPEWEPTDAIELVKNAGEPAFYAKVVGMTGDDMLDCAQAVCAVMKGGLNHKERKVYVKGYIQRQYFDDNGMGDKGSEKAFIKQRKIGGYAFVPSHDTREYDEYLYTRALLGLADKYEFKDGLRTIGTVYIYGFDTNGDYIERFPSPMLVKVIGEYLFFIFHTAESIQGTQFYLYDKYKKVNLKERDREKNINEIKKNGKAIITPNDIDWNRFIQGFIAYFKSKQSELKKWGGAYQKAANEKFVLKEVK